VKKREYALPVVAAAAVTAATALEFLDRQAAIAAGLILFTIAAVCVGAFIVILARDRE